MDTAYGIIHYRLLVRFGAACPGDPLSELISLPRPVHRKIHGFKLLPECGQHIGYPHLHSEQLNVIARIQKESGLLLFVEMPGIEPGSDVAFVRLLRAQSARSFIDHS